VIISSGIRCASTDSSSSRQNATGGASRPARRGWTWDGVGRHAEQLRLGANLALLVLAGC